MNPASPVEVVTVNDNNDDDNSETTAALPDGSSNLRTPLVGGGAAEENAINCNEEDDLIAEAMASLRKKLNDMNVNYDFSLNDSTQQSNGKGRALFGNDTSVERTETSFATVETVTKSKPLAETSLSTPLRQQSTTTALHSNSTAAAMEDSSSVAATRPNPSSGSTPASLRKSLPLFTPILRNNDGKRIPPSTAFNSTNISIGSPLDNDTTNNQSYMTSPPEPVQTPYAPKTATTTPDLETPINREQKFLFESLLETIEDLRERLDEQEIRLELVERDNAQLRSETMYWRQEAKEWQQECQGLLREVVSAKKRSVEEFQQRDWRRPTNGRESAYEEKEDHPTHRQPRKDYSSSVPTNRRGDTRTPRKHDGYHANFERGSSRQSTPYRYDFTSPGGRFVEGLSESLALDSEQSKLLASLMDRYFEDDESFRRKRYK
jgi:hypothetical protein